MSDALRPLAGRADDEKGEPAGAPFSLTAHRPQGAGTCRRHGRREAHGDSDSPHTRHHRHGHGGSRGWTVCRATFSATGAVAVRRAGRTDHRNATSDLPAGSPAAGAAAVTYIDESLGWDWQVSCEPQFQRFLVEKLAGQPVRAVKVVLVDYKSDSKLAFGVRYPDESGAQANANCFAMGGGKLCLFGRRGTRRTRRQPRRSRHPGRAVYLARHVPGTRHKSQCDPPDLALGYLSAPHYSQAGGH